MVCQYMHFTMADASSMTGDQIAALRKANPNIPKGTTDENIRWRVWMDTADAALNKLATDGWRVSAVLPQAAAMVLYVLERPVAVQPSTGLLAQPPSA